MPDRIANAFKIVSEQRMEILTEGKQLGIVDKDLEIDTYIPHYMPSPRVLKSKNWLGIKKKTGLRYDILKNAVAWEHFFKTHESAEEVLDGWINFFEDGNDVKIKNKWIEHLFNTNQAKTIEDAIEKTKREFQLNKDFILGKLDTLVRPEIFSSFPFYDPSARRFWPLFISNSIYLIARIKNFGKNSEEIQKLAREVEKNQGTKSAQEFELLAEKAEQESRTKAIPEEIKNIIRIYGFA